jgi:hypothetical protein
MTTMVLVNAVRTLACDAVVDSIDTGAGAATLVFETSGDAEVATLTFSDPAFGGASNGVSTASAITSDTDAAGGTVAQASVYTSDPTKRWEWDAGTGGTSIIISSTTVGAGDTVSMSALTVTVPAS